MAGAKGTGSRGAALPFGARDVVLAAGFTCFLTTLFVYSAAAMPFQRFATLPAFEDVFGTMLRAAAPAGLIAAVLAALPRTRSLLRARPAALVGGALFLVGLAAFCAMVLTGAEGLGASASLAIDVTGALIGVGCVAQCLAWGRALAVCDLRRATGVVAAAAVGAALLGWVQLMLPEGVAVALFLACALVSVALPFGLGAVGGAPATAMGDAAGAAGAPVVATRVRAFLDVALVPAVGLALFAMLMAVRGELFFEDYPQYVAVQVVVAALVLGCVLLPTRRPLMQAIYRGLIPTLGVAVLAVNYVSEALVGGTSAEIMLVMVLYTAAALLTLSTLAGMAHAAEFPTDLISALAVGLFALVTVAAQQVFGAADLGDDGVRAFIVVSSGAYAAGMIVLAIWCGLGSGDAFLPEGGAPARATGPSWLRRMRAGGSGTGEGLAGAGLAGAGRPDAQGGGAPLGDRAAAGLASRLGGAPRDEALDALGPTLAERCDALASRYALTGREREILGYLALGHSGVYIGDELLISPNTVRTHIHNIYRKLGVGTREDVLLLVRDAR